MAFTVDDQLIGQVGDEAAGVVALLCRSKNNGPPHALGGAVHCGRQSPVAKNSLTAKKRGGPGPKTLMLTHPK